MARRILRNLGPGGHTAISYRVAWTARLVGAGRDTAGAAGRASGSLIRNWQPGPVFRTLIWPECASTIPRAIDRPRPAPPDGSGVRALSPRNATSNTRGRSPGG